MEKLDESVVIRILREEWEARKTSLREELKTVFKPSKKAPEKPAISPGLKIKHKKSGILYTVDSVGHDQVIIRKPEGNRVLVPNDQIEKDFELD